MPCKIGTLFLAQKSNIFNANFAEFVEENVNLWYSVARELGV